ncbi:class I SAM-dependent methyltransferase [Bacillus suaedae]|uniref:Methyltransferase domain-containing protein n=1 Tax=Halalkalibacter suaedae TaxID=2822140 RepID=A0A940WYH4_9BACI|nr:class I SAM-dependent methyltransferase [Bacillus suaedae]MBP3953107.1 methyltransferase domain-containing protein [Bacillus suaedae]
MEQKQHLIDAFTKSLPDYLSDVENPSGKLFYSITWNQIEAHLKKERPLKILDIGCGFGLTSNWLSELGHEVTGIDITPDMIETARQKAEEKGLNIRFLVGDVTSLEPILQSEAFDFILCHNVLGYMENPTEILEKLQSLLTQDGYISIINHNPASKVLKKALVEEDLTQAKEVIGEEQEFNPLIGAVVHQYSTETYYKWFDLLKFQLTKHYGIRCVFDYLHEKSTLQHASHVDDLLALESELGKISPYKDIAFFSHFIIQRTT